MFRVPTERPADGRAKPLSFLAEIVTLDSEITRRFARVDNIKKCGSSHLHR